MICKKKKLKLKCNLYGYPNQESLNINIESKESKINSLVLINTISSAIKQYFPASIQFTIERNDLPAGIYYLKIHTDQGSITKPIILTE